MQKQGWINRLPSVALGLFMGRILSEWVAHQLPLGQLPILAITLLTTAATLWLLYYRSFAQSWPLLLLLVYVLAPELNPKLAATAVLLTTLTLLQQTRWPAPLPNWLLPLAALLLYLTTLAPGLLTADNGEFQLIATNLGVAHPPGFPLYTMLGHLATKLPVGATPAYRLNLFAALTSAATLWLVQNSTLRLTQSKLAAVTAVCTLATATTFWAQATTANIRSLTALFAALTLHWLIRYAQEPHNRPRHLVLAALSLSLGVTHHASLAFMGLVWISFVFAIDPTLLRQPRRWLLPITAGLAGLLPLLYLPLRGLAVQNGASVRGASASLATWDGFWYHVLALGFRGDLFYFTSPADLWARAQVMGNVLTFQFAPWLLAGMGAGLLLLLWRRQWGLMWLLSGAFLLHTFITATYRAPQTVEYMLPAYVPLVLLLGYAVGELGKQLAAKDAKNAKFFSTSFAIKKLLLAGLLTAVFHQTVAHYPSYRALSQTAVARNTVQPLLQDAPANSVILSHWHWATPLWYLQEVEGMRPDVEIRFVFPTAEPYEQTWARRVAENLANGRSVITTQFHQDAYAALPPPEPLYNAFLFRQEPRTAPPANQTPLAVTLDNSIQLHGYHVANHTEIGQETVLSLTWQPTAGQESVALYVHLLDENGRLQAQDDQTLTPQPHGLTVTQFRLTPRYGAAPGPHTINIGTPNGASLPLGSLLVTAMSQAPVTTHPLFRTALVERPLQRLSGYDWDHTLPNQPRLYLHWQTEQGYQTEPRDTPNFGTLPPFIGAWGLITAQSTINSEQPCLLAAVPCRLSPHNHHYVPLGQGIFWINGTIPNLQAPITNHPLTLPLTFHSRQPVSSDLVVSVRLIGYEADGFHWAWWDLDDSIPALGGIPSLKWISGSRVTARHQLTPSPNATAGQKVAATLRLYDAFNNRPLPLLDERLLSFTGIPLSETTFAE